MTSEDPTSGPVPFRIPIRSLSGVSEDATEALRLATYLDELERQAKITTRSLQRAWVPAVTQPEPDLDSVWADLQAALFASIVVERILLPNLNSIRSKPPHTKAQARDWAAQRATALRDLLDIPDEPMPDGLPMFAVSDVRHPLEHIDERFDRLVLDEVTSLSDFYISHGRAFESVTSDNGAGAMNFRVFAAPHGLLLFDGAYLDLYRLDHYLIELLADSIPEARRRLTGLVAGRNLFGGQRLVDLAPDAAEPRIKQFLDHRRSRGYPVPVTPLPLGSG